MSFNRYYEDEHAYLKEMGEEFSKIYPKLTRYLSSSSNDPDVERILEGFAFLTAKVREKLEDELPELTHSIINLLWPNYLRHIPSLTIMKYKIGNAKITEKSVIKKGLEIDSKPIDNIKCRFKTCFNVNLYPIDMNEPYMESSQKTSKLNIPLHSISKTAISDMKLDNINFYLGGSPLVANTLYLWIFRYLKHIEVELIDEGKSLFLDKKYVQRCGLKKEEEVIPFPKNSFEGYRILQEYFCFPDKFRFVDINFPEGFFAKTKSQNIKIIFHFERLFPQDIQLRGDNIHLYCTPAINLFSLDADPINNDKRRPMYAVVPNSQNDGEYKIFSIDNVSSSSNKSSGFSQKEYNAFESFQHEIERENFGKSVYYKVHVMPGLKTEDIMYYISFIDHDGNNAALSESVSISMSCSNGNLPSNLAPGEINDVTTGSNQSFESITNITKPTVSVPPPMSGALHWLLISNLSLNYTSLTNKESLQTILYAYDYHAHFDVQAERVAKLRQDGLLDVSSKRIDRLFKGLPIRGLRTTIKVKIANFSSEGDMYLFLSSLAEFFRLYSSINSFHELVAYGEENGEEYRWSHMIGQKFLI